MNTIILNMDLCNLQMPGDTFGFGEKGPENYIYLF